MPWRIVYNPSLSGERGLYPLRARYQGNLDVGFFIAQNPTPLFPNIQPRGPPFQSLLAQKRQTIHTLPFTLRPHDHMSFENIPSQCLRISSPFTSHKHKGTSWRQTKSK